MTLYDVIGRGYGELRRPDHRIKRLILDALANASSVVNVGAGAGSYEPTDRPVIGVERSMTMIHQRSSDAPPVVLGAAEALPFDDGAFAAAMAVLTIHHWSDLGKGLRELRRVARDRIVIVTQDPAECHFWLMDYFPELRAVDERIFPSMSRLERELGSVEVSAIPVPHDCRDGFTGAYWRHPEAYLDPKIRSAMSTFSKVQHPESGLDRLRQDLSSGAWQQKYGAILNESEMALGYRLVVAES